MFVLTLLVFTMLVVRGSSSNYFFAYYLDQREVMAFLERVGLGGSAGPATGWSAVLDSLGLLVRPDGSNAAAVGLSLFFVVGSLVQIGGILVSKPLADRFGKKAVFVAGASVTTLATALVFLAGPTQVGLMFWLSILWAVGWGPTIPLLWVMIADVADHSEWLTGRRATGFSTGTSRTWSRARPRSSGSAWERASTPRSCWPRASSAWSSTRSASSSTCASRTS
jgi:glycoside/pentoside/hexuronide:cation symporter, GPH family